MPVVNTFKKAAGCQVGHQRSSYQHDQEDTTISCMEKGVETGI